MTKVTITLPQEAKLSYSTIDKSKWPSGPWKDEPDRAFWMDRGHPCEIIRHSNIGHLCGYIEVKPGHPWHGKSTDDLPDITVHGGITYAEPTDHLNWKIGFDCAHLYDLTPGNRHSPLDNEVYRDFDYVRRQVGRLVDQALEAGK